MNSLVKVCACIDKPFLPLVKLMDRHLQLMKTSSHLRDVCHRASLTGLPRQKTSVMGGAEQPTSICDTYTSHLHCYNQCASDVLLLSTIDQQEPLLVWSTTAASSYVVGYTRAGLHYFLICAFLAQPRSATSFSDFILRLRSSFSIAYLEEMCALPGFASNHTSRSKDHGVLSVTWIPKLVLNDDH
jgi:hypothetical protein